MERFTIHSNESNSYITFSEREGEFFSLEVSSGDFSAKKKVSTYTDELGIYNLFSKAATTQSAWKEPLLWESLEGECTLQLSCSVTGSVNICVKINHWNSGSENWHTTSNLTTDLGVLEVIEGQAKSFFRA